jgi:hypothetical protein
VALIPLAKNRVALIASGETQRLLPLLKAVARATDLELIQWSDHFSSSVAGVVVVKSARSMEPLPDFPPNLPSFRIELFEMARSAIPVTLTDDRALSPMLRGRRFLTPEPLVQGSQSAIGVALAEANGVSVWVTRDEHGVRHDVNMQAEPWIAEDDRLFEHLNAHNMMRLLPLIEWLRSISDWAKWRKPPVRACFIFDDPNLHAEHYGFLSFPRLADEGRLHRYHTAFATVPLDQYYVSKSVAKLFRENPGQLSLLVHGSDHSHRELARNESSAQLSVRLRRALKWIEGLERREGIPVARVMAPPHGAFAGRSLRGCVSAGFEAACVSWGSVWYSNQNEQWARFLGVQPAAIVEGLPVIPRFGLCREVTSQIMLAAYLDQPIIPILHQADLAGGIELLSDLAGSINGLGDVKWQNMAEIARSNFWWRQEGDVLFVLPHSRRFTIDVPDGTRFVKIIEPCLTGRSSPVSFSVTSTDNKVELCENLSDGAWTLPVEGPRVVTVKMENENYDAGEPLRRQPFPLKALIRRVLTEGRDRATPLASRRWWRA